MLGWLRRLFRRRPVDRHGPSILRDVAKHTSCPVRDLSSRLSLPIGTVFGVLAELERQGLVRVSKAQGQPNARIVAITTKGRESLRR